MYEEWIQRVQRLVGDFHDSKEWESMNMEDLEDWVDMLNTLVSFAPRIPPEKIEAARNVIDEQMAPTNP
jgi:hypothetical protein